METPLDCLTLDIEDLKLYILRRLGAPLLCVELTEDHLKDAICDALRWFAAKKGLIDFYEMQFSAQVEYKLPDHVDTVIDVVLPSKRFDIDSAFFPTMGLTEGQIPYDMTAPSTLGIYSSFVQGLQYLDAASRVVGSDLDWRQEGRLLYIFPANKRAGKAFIYYKTSNIDLKKLNVRDIDLIKRYAVAAAKRILGRIRSKYDGALSAQGTVGLDGNTLLDEARDEIEKLEEEIELSGFPMGFLTG